MPTFSPPTRDLYFDPPLDAFHTLRGQTVYKSGGTWTTVEDPFWDDLVAADVVATADLPGGEKIDNRRDYYVFLGGRDYTVSSAVGAELTSAGYTVT